MLQNDYNGDHGHSNLGGPVREIAVTDLILGLAHTIIQLRVKYP